MRIKKVTVYSVMQSRIKEIKLFKTLGKNLFTLPSCKIKFRQRREKLDNVTNYDLEYLGSKFGRN